MLLAWIPLMFFIVPTVIGLIMSFSQVSSQKATGLGAVAGGISEFLLTFGLAAFVASEIAGVILLVRTFSKGHVVRTFFAVFSICCSAVILSILGFIVWQITTRRHP